MYYNAITITGFGSYHSTQTINFTPGTNLITGVNGSGKSTIIDAIQWNIFGPKGSDRSLSDRTSIINDHSRTARVVLEFTNDAQEKIVSTRSLTRSGKHSLDVSVDGDHVSGGLTASQNVLNDAIFGISADAFTAVSMIRSAPSLPVSKFISGNSVEKREILATLVDPAGLWESTHTVMEKRLKNERATLRSVEDDSTAAHSVYDSLRVVHAPEGNNDKNKQELASLLSQRSRSDVTHEDKVQMIQLDIDKLATSITKNERELDALHDDCERLEEDIDTYTHTIREAKRNFDKQKNDDVDEEISSHRMTIESTNTQLDTLKNRIADLSSVITREKTLSDMYNNSNGTCLVCGAPLDTQDDDTRSTTNTHEHIIEDMSMCVDDMTRRYDYLTSYVSTMNNYIQKRIRNRDNTNWTDVIERAENDKQNAIRKLESCHTSSDTLTETISEQKNSLAELRAELRAAKQEHPAGRDDDSARIDARIEELRDAIATFDRQMDSYQNYVHDREEFSRRVDRCDKAVREQRAVVHAFQTLREQTSVKGAISEDIDTICREISESANIMHEGAFGQDKKISLSTVMVKDTPTSTITALGRPIETFSHGEQNRMIMCVLMGVTGALYSRYNVWLPPLWDEPTSVIDSDDSDSACVVVSNRPDNEQAIVIIREYDNSRTCHYDNIIELSHK